jgi:2-hydroxychromene-2-carboxylate isomerase
VYRGGAARAGPAALCLRAMDFGDPRRLYFFFDFVSHNAYLAWHKAPALARAHGLKLTPVPVVFGAMLSHYGQVGPGEIPVKSLWMRWNVLRKACQHGIPIAPPASHPFNPLLPLRVCCAELDEPAREALIDRLYRATWAESRPVAEAATVRAILAELKLPADALLEQAQTAAVKLKLRHNTDTALARGVFGVPSFIARGELFWGFDDLPWLDAFLAGRDVLPADRSAFAAWDAVRPSAERRRA